MHPRRSYGRWRLLLAPPRSGAENMARDTALQARAADRRPSSASTRGRVRLFHLAGINQRRTLRHREDSLGQRRCRAPPDWRARDSARPRGHLQRHGARVGFRTPTRDLRPHQSHPPRRARPPGRQRRAGIGDGASTGPEHASLLRNSRRRVSWSKREQARWQRTMAGRWSAVATRLDPRR